MFMNTRNTSSSTSDDSAFPHINGINMEVAVELPGQEIARHAAAIDDEEKGSNDCVRIEKLREQVRALRRRQQALRAEEMAGVRAVFAEYGRSRP